MLVGSGQASRGSAPSHPLMFPSRTDSTIKGISVDVDGFVWAVTGSAHKITPDAPYAFDGSYTGLSGPYTYSDMTGWGLQNAAYNPAG